MNRLLVPASALLWGLQFAFLNPALVLLLVAVFHAGPGEVGLVLAGYNASGFLASVLLPAYADRRQDYLRPMVVCGVLTLALAGLLAATSSLSVAFAGLVLLGAPAGVGVTLLFAYLAASGAGRSDVVNTRAVVSFAWVAGPPVAGFVISGFGNRAILAAIAAVAGLNLVATAGLLARHAAARAEPAEVDDGPGRDRAPLAVVATVVAAVVALQATNSAAVSVLNLFVLQTLRLDVVWAGVALSVSALLEIPALLLIGRLGARFSDIGLIAAGCVAGIGYYAGMAVASGPVPLLALQVLNAAFIAVVAGVGLALFQRIIPRPGLASGLYTNTRRIGAIISGPIIALGALGTLGYRGVFLACAALTAAALPLLLLARRRATAPAPLDPLG